MVYSCLQLGDGCRVLGSAPTVDWQLNADARFRYEAQMQGVDVNCRRHPDVECIVDWFAKEKPLGNEISKVSVAVKIGVVFASQLYEWEDLIWAFWYIDDIFERDSLAGTISECDGSCTSCRLDLASKSFDSDLICEFVIIVKFVPERHDIGIGLRVDDPGMWISRFWFYCSRIDDETHRVNKEITRFVEIWLIRGFKVWIGRVLLILSVSFGHLAVIWAVTTHIVMFAVLIRFVWEFRPFIAAFLIPSTISAIFALVLPLILTFAAFRLIAIVVSSIESSSQSLDCERFCFRCISRLVCRLKP